MGVNGSSAKDHRSRALPAIKFARACESVTCPWTKIVDLGLTYRPAFADNKLAVTLQAFNIFNERKPLQVDSTWEDDTFTLSNTYNMGRFFTQPRYAMFSVSYDY